MSTTRKEHEMQCPKCGTADALDVTCQTDVRLTADGTDNDESENGSHEWDDESGCTCGNCSWHGTVRDARNAFRPLLALDNEDKADLLEAIRYWLSDHKGRADTIEGGRMRILADSVKAALNPLQDHLSADGKDDLEDTEDKE